VTHDDHVDCLPAATKSRWNISDTEAVSAHPYDDDIVQLVGRYDNGLVLDAGAGKRPVYFDNVVNYEIVAYDTTDVVNLFADLLDVERVEVSRHLLPIWALTWICSRWAEGLSGATKDEFLGMRIADFIGSPVPHLDQRYVTGLSATVNSELAAGHALFAHKPPSPVSGRRPNE
jgi:hypothetical protein